MTEIENANDMATLTVQLLSAYLANNSVGSDDLPALIIATRKALTEDTPVVAASAPAAVYEPAVSVRKSLSSDAHIISLIDGRPYKTLKRHLSAHGLTPDTYRERYGLPATYPMVAPEFAAQRRAIAKRIGLGSGQGSESSEAVAAGQIAAPVEAATTAAPATLKAASATVGKGDAAASNRIPAKAAPADAGPRKPKRVEAPKPTKKVEPEAVTAGTGAKPNAKAKENPKPAAKAKGKAPAGTATTNTATQDEAAKGGAVNDVASVTGSAPASVQTPESEIAVAPAGAPAVPAGEKPAPRKRGKLGLFGAVAPAKTEVPGVGEPTTPANTPAAGKAVSASKAKRTASQPKGHAAPQNK